MAIIYLVRNPQWNPNRKVLLASIQSVWKDETGVEHPTDLFGELETIVDRYLTEVQAANRDLPSGRGLAEFPEPAAEDSDAE